MLPLSAWGWNDVLQTQFDAVADASLRPARVLSASSNRCQIIGSGTPAWAELSGRCAFAQDDPFSSPAVGDWVAARLDSEPPIIEAVLSRLTTLVRKRAGRVIAPQLVAANLDYVFVVTALGPDLNARRLERYLAAVWEGGAEPVVIVNKMDVPDHSLDSTALRSVVRDVPVVPISAIHDTELDPLDPWLTPAATVAFVGSSGVGKSTIINRLLGRQRQETQAVREDDHKGRHTTTRRELLRTPGGAMVIDTPGMREFGLWEAEHGLAMVFEDVESAAQGCRFRDCTHSGEPGCQVAAAVAEGELAAERIDSYQRLQREVAYHEERAAEGRSYDTKKRWKAVSKAIRQHRKLERDS